MNKKAELSFEEAMEVLERAVDKLEDSELSLDESILEFEKAIDLIKLCESKLSAAKQRVSILTEAADGTITNKPFTDLSDET